MAVLFEIKWSARTLYTDEVAFECRPKYSERRTGHMNLSDGVFPMEKTANLKPRRSGCVLWQGEGV